MKRLKKRKKEKIETAATAVVEEKKRKRRVEMNVSKVGNQTSSQDPQAVNSRLRIIDDLKFYFNLSGFLLGISTRSK